MSRFYWSLFVGGGVRIRDSGLIDMEAAGVESLTAPEFPLVGKVCVATAVRVESSDPRELTLSVEMISPSGRVLTQREHVIVTGSSSLLLGEHSRENLAFDLGGFDFEEAGTHIVRLTCAGDTAELELVVRPEG